ncbi:MAG TPA: triose-phosphate isomerase [Planctomycetota bacterium]|nr:triose-phosphate isomerase [Planctomycetota bacterium]
MRKPFIAGNWKMNKDLKGALELANGLKRKLADVEGVEIGLFPPALFLPDLVDACRDSGFVCGAQNMHWEEKGAFTGEISAPMILSVGATHVIIGHSERRQFFGETNDTVNKKMHAAMKHGVVPIMCVGEMLEEREANKTQQVVSAQVRGGLKNLTPEDMAKVVIAYEPVWAIGTGKTASPAQAQEVHALIRRLLAEMFGDDVAQGVRIQYGGSVKGDNVKTLMAQPDIDGALVGGASLDVDSFAAIVNFKEA